MSTKAATKKEAAAPTLTLQEISNLKAIVAKTSGIPWEVTNPLMLKLHAMEQAYGKDNGAK